MGLPKTGSYHFLYNNNMQHNDCFQLGHITRTHGTRGEVVIYLDVDYPEDYEELESVFVEIKGQLIPYFVKSINVQKGSKAIVKFEDINSIEAATPLINCPLFLPEDNLDELDGSQFYYHEIIGFKVVDDKLGELGTVTTVYTMSTQDLIAMNYNGHEVLIPVNDTIVPGINRQQKVLNVRLPEGLLDVYLEEGTAAADDDDTEID
jgi:16S rRNA processing protein RimM|nr:ribosome maturation factor RimM [Runella sp.]